MESSGVGEGMDCMEGADMIDTHCHLDLEPLCSGLPRVIADARSAGVNGFVMPAVHPGNWNRIAEIAAEYVTVMPAYGVHPMHAACVDDALLERLHSVMHQGVAIGETGLDAEYAVSMQLQEIAFREQLKLAVSAGLPVLIHCRGAFQRTLQVLKEEKVQQVGGIMHAFSGSVEMAREFIRLGLMISISGVVTRPNAKRCANLVRELPLQHLVVETDAPDLPPERYQGRANQPAWLIETVNAMASIKGVSPQVIAEQCTLNSRAILRHLSILQAIA